jgi:sortase A
MTKNNTLRNTLSVILIVAGMILLLAGCSTFVRQQVEGQQVRAELQETPVVVPTAPPTTLASPASAPTAVVAATVVATATTPAATATVAPARVAATGPEIPVRIVIPDLKLDAKVVEMGWQIINTAAGPQSDWVIPKSAAGHHINSALLNETGNVVISGHNNIEGKVFEPISLAWDERAKITVDAITDRSESLKGRKIQLYNAAGTAFDYTITDFLRLKDSGVSQEQRLKNARFMDPTDERRLTLVTCWPPWSNTHRLVVIAKPAQP